MQLIVEFLSGEMDVRKGRFNESTTIREHEAGDMLAVCLSGCCKPSRPALARRLRFSFAVVLPCP